jgi:hypothetical protein
MGGLRVWALAAVLVGSVGCGSVHTLSAAKSDTSVPWLPLPPGHQSVDAPPASPVAPIPVPAGTPECQAGQLEGVVSGAGAAAGNVDTPLLFRNTGVADCWLEGYLGITMFDAAGRVLATSTGSANEGTFFDDGPVTMILLLAGTPLLVSGRGMDAAHGVRGQAWMNMSWYDCSSPQASHAIVELPSGARFSMPVTLGGAENGACFPGSTFKPVIFRGPLSPGGVGWPPAPDYISVRVSIQAPAFAPRGSTLDYTVTLKNLSARGYDMRPCPDYVESFDWKKVGQTYQLNCLPVMTIRPGGAATFEMRMAIPASTPAGPNNIHWFLFDGRLDDPGAAAVLSIS